MTEIKGTIVSADSMLVVIEHIFEPLLPLPRYSIEMIKRSTEQSKNGEHVKIFQMGYAEENVLFHSIGYHVGRSAIGSYFGCSEPTAILQLKADDKYFYTVFNRVDDYLEFLEKLLDPNDKLTSNEFKARMIKNAVYDVVMRIEDIEEEDIELGKKTRLEMKAMFD